MRQAGCNGATTSAPGLRPTATACCATTLYATRGRSTSTTTPGDRRPAGSIGIYATGRSSTTASSSAASLFRAATTASAGLRGATSGRASSASAAGLHSAARSSSSRLRRASAGRAIRRTAICRFLAAVRGLSN